MIYKKICLLGDFAVGKTSLVRRFVDRQFSDQYLSTIGVKISRKQVNVPSQKPENSQPLQLMIWDIEGETRFKQIMPTYLKGASGAIIVADVTRNETINQLPKHIDSFLSVNEKSLIVVAFNKCDLVPGNQIDRYLNQITQFQTEKILSVYQTSAKNGMNVDDMFLHLSRQLIEN